MTTKLQKQKVTRATKKAAVTKKSTGKPARRSIGIAKTKTASKTKTTSKSKATSTKTIGVPSAYQAYTKDEFKRYQGAKRKFALMKTEKLKAYLKANAQSRSGDKSKQLLVNLLFCCS
jgi:hypothetical protein